MKNNRIEYKYYVNFYKRTQFLNDILPHFKLDPHANAISATYSVSSIYFDDHKLSSYHEKLEGHPIRVKQRLRFYPSSNGKHLFLEFKHKTSDRIYKNKTKFPIDQLPFFLDFPNMAFDVTDQEGEDFFFRMRIKYRQLKPLLRIDYSRIAMTMKNDSRVRVSLDSCIKTARVRGREMTKTWIPVIPGHLSILEIKTPNYLPTLLTGLIGKYNLQRRAISKYALAMQKLGLNSAMSHY